jgi:hypothetical protein
MTSPTPYPRPGPEGLPEPTGWRRLARGSVIPLAILGGLATIAGLGFAFLWAMNPMGDEWVCSDGEAPARNACYRLDQPLPPGPDLGPARQPSDAVQLRQERLDPHRARPP